MTNPTVEDALTAASQAVDDILLRDLCAAQRTLLDSVKLTLAVIRGSFGGRRSAPVASARFEPSKDRVAPRTVTISEIIAKRKARVAASPPLLMQPSAPVDTKGKQRRPERVAGAPAVLTADEFCAALGINRVKLQALVRAGRVRPIRLGHATVRYLASEIERLA